MSGGNAILLLGRRDEPTDGVEDYCHMLRDAAARRGLSFEIARVHWAEKGWRDALAELRKEAADWRGCCVLLQFTTLAWSGRGFPLHAPRVLRLLRQCGARAGVVFHDFFPVRGKLIVGQAREYCQARVFRQLYAVSELAIFTVPINKISWLPTRREKATFIPVGSNFPEIGCAGNESAPSQSATATVAVFGITDGDKGKEEIEDIAYVLSAVRSSGTPLRLVVFGRGTKAFEQEFRQALSNLGIEVSILGLIPATDLVQILARATVLLSVRGHVSTRRGSAIAGIACSLPIVGYRGEETGFPVTEAGVMLVSQGNREGLAHALMNILRDERLCEKLRRRSEAAKQYFSWAAIASQFATAISTPEDSPIVSPSDRPVAR